MKQKQDIFTTLGGRVRFRRGAYNPTSDAIFLAAFVKNAGRGGRILDVGIGSGGAALALLARIPDAKITGIDSSEQMLAECAENAKLNERDVELIHGDIMTWKTARTFDVVMTNPPYFKGTPRRGAADAHHNVNLGEWVRACLRRVRPLGSFYCIIDTAVFADIIAAIVDGKAGNIELVPLFGGDKKSAERVLISARLGARGGTKVYAGRDMNDDRILRDMGGIS